MKAREISKLKTTLPRIFIYAFRPKAYYSLAIICDTYTLNTPLRACFEPVSTR